MKFSFSVQVDAVDEAAAQQIKEKLSKFEFHGNVIEVLTKLEKGDILISSATKGFIRKRK